MFRSAWCINTDWVSWRSDDSTLWRGERCYNDWSSDARSVAWAARDNTWVRDTDQRWYSGWWCHWHDGRRSLRHNEPEPEQPIARCDSWKDGCSWNDGGRGWRNGDLAYERCNRSEREQPNASRNEETFEESIETACVILKRLQEERAMRQRLMLNTFSPEMRNRRVITDQSVSDYLRRLWAQTEMTRVMENCRIKCPYCERMIGFAHLVLHQRENISCYEAQQMECKHHLPFPSREPIIKFMIQLRRELHGNLICAQGWIAYLEEELVREPALSVVHRVQERYRKMTDYLEITGFLTSGPPVRSNHIPTRLVNSKLTMQQILQPRTSSIGLSEEGPIAEEELFLERTTDENAPREVLQYSPSCTICGGPGCTWCMDRCRIRSRTCMNKQVLYRHLEEDWEVEEPILPGLYAGTYMQDSE